MPDRFAVALARMTENDAEDMRPLALALDHDPGSLAKVHLHLRAGFTFHPPPRQRRGRTQAPDKALHRLIAADELDLRDQVLVNPLG